MFLRRHLITTTSFIALLVTIIVTQRHLYLASTIEVPLTGGIYREALVGQPQHLNPIFAVNNTDQDITSLIFSSLIKRDEHGTFVPDLATNWEVSADGKQYDSYLKENISWHDNELFTVDDAFFTIALLQNPETPSPLRTNFSTVLMEKVAPYHIRFKLSSPYAFFLNNLTVGILPFHLLKDISPNDLLTNDFSINPIGTGPFKMKEVIPREKVGYSSIVLERSENYYQQKPFLDEVVFKFYNENIDAINAYIARDVDALGSLSLSDLSDIEHRAIRIFKVPIPEIQAVFFNLNSPSPLQELGIRRALADATFHRDALANTFSTGGFLVDNPLFTVNLQEKSQGIVSSTEPSPVAVALSSIQASLEQAGWKENPETKMREKDGKPLEFSLISTSNPDDITTANTLISLWQDLGVGVNHLIFQPKIFYSEYVAKKQYDAVILKLNLGLDADQYPLWHSSQRLKDGSYNFANYENKEVDRFLQDARRIMDPEKRDQVYSLFASRFASDIPALFLYSPYYLYAMDTTIKGVSMPDVIAQPSGRFRNIVGWYINAQRVAK